jgi:hypothetical protein
LFKVEISPNLNKSGPCLIPQAYTARDIGDAYKWSQSLPAPAREEMKTMEQMVYAYLKAKTQGALNNNNYQPDGIKKSVEFQKTLLNLKSELEQFDSAPAAPATPVSQAYQNSLGATTQSFANQSPTIETQRADFPKTELKLDSKSRQIIEDIREGLNLSSDMEVIRMSLVLAHKTVKNLIE